MSENIPDELIKNILNAFNAAIVEGKIFDNADIVLDNHHYSNCKFNNCLISYYGGSDLSLNNCDFDGCSFAFGGVASDFLEVIIGLVNAGFPVEKLLNPVNLQKAPTKTKQ